MGIQDFMTKLFVIYRSVWATDEDGNSYSEEQEVGSFNGHIQQAQAEDIQNLALTFTKAFSIWCPVDTAVLEGDTLESVDGVYSVKAIQKYDTGGNTHLQLVVQVDEVIRGS
ncbi:MAG: hypothetical protein WC499_02475 [Patescibacteria group bacterium]